jgi:hypothetical protein
VPDDEEYEGEEETVQEPTPLRPRQPAAREREEAPHPIAQIDTPDQLKGRVRFTRSLQLGSGRNDQAHFSLEMEFSYPPEADLAAVAAMAADVFFQTKATVYEQAGLEMTLDEAGVLHEVVRKAIAADSTPAASGGGGGSAFPNPSDMNRPSHIKADVWRDLVENFGDYYDNRPQKANGEYKSNAPDFKHRDSGEAIWLTAPRRGSR